jgi:hypothetical protein
MSTNRAWNWLCSIVVAHLLVSFVHGTAHMRARVDLPPASQAFVYTVILAGPLVGLAVGWRARRPGSWLIAATMTAALLFGVVNHFVLMSPDHVSQVAAEWRGLFATTAAILAVLEAAGAALAWKVSRARSM